MATERASSTRPQASAEDARSLFLDQTCGKRTCAVFCYPLKYNEEPVIVRRCACGPGIAGFKRKRNGIVGLRVVQSQSRGRRPRRATGGDR